MAKRAVHVSDTEAASDFAALLARVRAGAEVVIEDNGRPVAILAPAEPRTRLLSESLRIAQARGSHVTADPDFAKDVEAAVNCHREPLTPPEWD